MAKMDTKVSTESANEKNVSQSKVAGGESGPRSSGATASSTPPPGVSKSSDPRDRSDKSKGEL